MNGYTITVAARALLVVVCLCLTGCVVAEAVWMAAYRDKGGYGERPKMGRVTVTIRDGRPVTESEPRPAKRDHAETWEGRAQR